MQNSTKHTVVEGDGKLKTTSGTLAVHYGFDVYQHVAVQGQQVIGRGVRQCSGTVQPVDDPRTIPNGRWHPELESGEQWALENDNGHWVRVSNG
jgi:hypothetical protein